MPALLVLLKDILIVGFSVFTGILISFGVIPPEQAVAPEDKPPAPIVVEPQNTQSSQQEPAQDVPATQEEPTVQEEEVSKTSQTDPLQEALDALAQIAEEEVSQEQTAAASTLNDTVRSTVVNILCTTQGGGLLKPISGSGVVVDPRGVILTNAHVAQYFLLKDYIVDDFINCIIRTGSPAAPTYTVDLLFLPPSWIADNAHKIDDEQPRGNGEHDYAFLRITGIIGAGEVPLNLTYLPLITVQPRLGESVLLASYPAGFLGGATIQTDLFAASAEAIVRQLFTFETTTVDLFSIGGSIVAQQGSSGGAVAKATSQSSNGAAILGLIVTSSDAPDTASRDLRALSTEYIIRDFESERGIPLGDYLERDLAQEQALFEFGTAPTLTRALTDILDN